MTAFVVLALIGCWMFAAAVIVFSVCASASRARQTLGWMDDEQFGLPASERPASGDLALAR